MNRLWTLPSVVLLTVAMTTSVLESPAAASPTPAYQATDLGTLGGAWSAAHAINNRDEIVGGSQTADGRNHPFLWRNGIMTDLGQLDASGEGFGVATDINDAGQVIGVSEGRDGMHSFLWTDGVLTDLGTLGGSYTVAWAINNRGQVVGYSFPAGVGPAHGFLWQRGVMTDLGELTEAVDINDRGQVIGRCGDPSTACLWTRGRTIILGLEGATAINDRGWIVGDFVHEDFSVGTGLWRSGRTTELATLGGTRMWAGALNDRGQVIGTSTTAEGALHGFLWQNGRMVDLADKARADFEVE